ncbi:MAG: TldD/PmbA family protein [Candidatus Thermoplasmatota archaeon]|nr:TldD/PmbA family protein [Candidatus Thermoplasmatota archaeon]
MIGQVLSLDEIRAIASRAVELASKKGADQAEAYVSMDASLDCGLEKEAIKGVGTRLSMGIGIRVIKDRRLGFSYATGETMLPEAIDHALRLSSLSTPTDMEFPGNHTPPMPENVFDPKILEMEPEDLVEGVKDMLAAVGEYKDVIALEGGIGCGLERFALATSNGMDVASEGTDSGGGMYTILREEPATGFHFEEHRMADIDMVDAAKKASEMALSSKNPKKIEPGLMPVIFMPNAFSSLAEFVLAPAFYGNKVRKGESVYSDKEGEKIMPDHVSILDDGLLENGLNTSSVDDEGVPSRTNHVVEKGVFKQPLFDRASALDNGGESTGNGVRCLQWSSSRSFKSPPDVKARNIVLHSETSHDIEKLIGEIKHGIVVHDLLGAHTSNPSSGDFSVNSSVVYLVENGEIKGPGKQVLISGNLPEAMNRIIGVANDYKNVSGGLSPIAFRLPSFAVDKLVVT